MSLKLNTTYLASTGTYRCVFEETLGFEMYVVYKGEMKIAMFHSQEYALRKLNYLINL